VIVVYTEPDAETIRIISLRKALSYEKKIMNNTSRTNWDRIDAMSDDEIDTSDIAPLTDEFFSKAKLRIPSSSLNTVAVRSDSETLDI
jgi:hypothetical protein